MRLIKVVAWQEWNEKRESSPLQYPTDVSSQNCLPSPRTFEFQLFSALSFTSNSVESSRILGSQEDKNVLTTNININKPCVWTNASWWPDIHDSTWTQALPGTSPERYNSGHCSAVKSMHPMKLRSERSSPCYHAGQWWLECSQVHYWRRPATFHTDAFPHVAKVPTRDLLLWFIPHIAKKCFMDLRIEAKTPEDSWNRQAARNLSTACRSTSPPVKAEAWDDTA